MYRNQRQRWLAHKIASRQPLVTRMARHQRLLHELMPTAGTSERINVLPDRRSNWTRQRALPLAGLMFGPLLIGEVEEERVLSSAPSPVPDILIAGQNEEDPGQEATFAQTAANTMDRTEIEPSSLPDKPEKVLSQQEVHVESVNQFLEGGGQELLNTGRLPETQMSESLEVHDQDILLDQQIKESAAAGDRSPEASSAHLENTEQPPGFNEPVEAKLQQEQKIVDERAQPIENAKTRHSRGRIQEQPVESGNTSPAQAAPPSPPSRMARRKEQEAVSKEASEADDLFAPQNTDRSPEAWMARLMGANSVPSNNMATPSTTVETETGGVQTRSVTGEQLERRQQPADSGQFIPPTTQDRSTPANEGLSRGGFLKRGEKRLRPVGAGVAGMRGGDARVAQGGRDEGDASVPTPPNPSPAPTVPKPPPRGHEKNLPVKANEGSATVTPQTDQDRRLKAGSQSLPSARANIARDTSEARPASTPLSQRARRFLQPLVGIDPASVHVHRDAIAEHLTDVYQADAITVGDDVAIAAGHPDDTPETLGLLAHEFTHVAHRREPRFVPPIARMGLPLSQERRALSMDEMAAITLSIPEDEEILAQQVERRVTRVAEEQVDQMASLPTVPSGSPVEPPAGAGTTGAVSVPRAARNSWGGLPAPWEPLPDWLVSSSVTPEGSGYAADVAPQPPQSAHEVGGAERALSVVYGGGSTWNGSGPGDTGVQRAGLERNLSEEEQTAASMQHPAPDSAKAPEADLDELARQVYTHLKRRLEVERRRES